MRLILLTCLFTAAMMRPALSQSSTSLSEPASSLDGTYSGDIAGTPSTLTLQLAGDAITGIIDAGGYRYSLDGMTNGTTGSGTLVDLQTGASMPFEVAAESGAVIVTIKTADPSTGQMQRVPFSFHRGGGQNHPGGPSTEPPATGQAAAVERDPSLIGAWTYSDTYISGDFSATTRLFMQVNPDGSYAYGSGSVSAGLDNSMGSVWGNSESGDVTRGQWRTQGGIVYVMEAGSPQWVPYARYYVEGGSLMLTFGNGKRQVWHRR